MRCLHTGSTVTFSLAKGSAVNHEKLSIHLLSPLPPNWRVPTLDHQESIQVIIGPALLSHPLDMEQTHTCAVKNTICTLNCIKTLTLMFYLYFWEYLFCFTQETKKAVTSKLCVIKQLVGYCPVMASQKTNIKVVGNDWTKQGTLHEFELSLSFPFMYSQKQ